MPRQAHANAALCTCAWLLRLLSSLFFDLAPNITETSILQIKFHSTPPNVIARAKLTLSVSPRVGSTLRDARSILSYVDWTARVIDILPSPLLPGSYLGLPPETEKR